MSRAGAERTSSAELDSNGLTGNHEHTAQFAVRAPIAKFFHESDCSGNEIHHARPATDRGNTRSTQGRHSHGGSRR